jgi:hypothetical protein
VYPAPPPTAPYPPSRQSDPYRPGGGGGWAIAVLLLVAALALGGYGLREVWRADGTQPGATELPAPTAGEPPSAREPDPGDTLQLEPERPAEGGPEAVSVGIVDYVADSGADAAEELTEEGLQPRVVDLDGAELDATEQEDCLVTGVEPTGSVEPGSTVTLTCVRLPS